MTTWTFVLPGLARPAGGLFAAYELANGLAGTDRVHVVHLPTPEARLHSPADLPWFTFHPAVEHSFPERLHPSSLPEGDLAFHTVMAVDLCLDAVEDRGAQALLAHLLGEVAGPSGLPMLFLQALAVFSEPTEMRAIAGAGPKVCVATWIARNLVRFGFPPEAAVAIVNGVDQQTFRVIRPIADRSPGIAMNHNAHPLKNMDVGLDALERIGRERGVDSVLFGARPPARALDDHLRFVSSPRQSEVAEDVLAAASLYLQPSTQEGFGLCALEAMACGCALVTTDNGGSEDYAVDGETAVLCEPDADSMVAAMTSLLDDDDRRIHLATQGAERAKRFRWSTGAEQLRSLGAAYLADPDRYGRDPRPPLDPSVRWLDRG